VWQCQRKTITNLVICTSGTTKKVFKKILYTKEYISSSDEDEVSDNETRRVLFMVVKDFDKEDFEEEYEEAEEECEEVKE
jgi:hypothetical protein